MKRSFLVVLSLWISIATYASNPMYKKSFFSKALGRMAQSEIVHRLNSSIASSIKPSGKPASSEFQKLGKEAQYAVGIPEKKHAPIREKSYEIDGPSAEALEEAIYINKNTFENNETPYGVNRCNLYHEAVHIKYHDAIFPDLLRLATRLTTSICAPFLVKMFKPQGKWKILYLVSVFPGDFVGKQLAKKYKQYYKQYYERRADIEGHYATQCHICVSDKARDIRGALSTAHKTLEMINSSRNREVLKNNKELLKYKRICEEFIKNKAKAYYLSADDNEKIANDLKQENKICYFHRESSV